MHTSKEAKGDKIIAGTPLQVFRGEIAIKDTGVRKRATLSYLRLPAFLLTLIAAAGLGRLYIRFDQSWTPVPPGLIAAGIPVGGLDLAQARERLAQAYLAPVSLHYGEAAISANPASLGCQIDLDGMFAGVERQRRQDTYWDDFKRFLLNNPEPPPQQIPLMYSCPEEGIRNLLKEIAARYDHPPAAAYPRAGTTGYIPGVAGTVLDIDGSIPLIQEALISLTNRQVTLPLVSADPPRPAIQNLEIQLRQILKVDGYDGLIGLSLTDLQTGQDIHFVSQGSKLMAAEPDAPFTASSTIKIPIMISVFRRLGPNPDPLVITRLKEMIGKSDNTATDWLMQNVIDELRGPLLVTEDVKALGLQNTFLAGYFHPGSPLLQSFQTPANQRIDLEFSLDPYSQTTPSDIATLLVDIYQCAKNGGGALATVFPGEISQEECQQMVEFLKMDHLPDLISGGVPEGTPVSHKHGWVSDAASGVVKDMGDAAIVHTPGGDYVLAIFLYHPNQLVWIPTDQMVEELSRAAYNFFNVGGGSQSNK